MNATARTAEKRPQTYEPGYKAVLVREETKARLQALRTTLPALDIHQERRLVSAALDMIMDRTDLHGEWLRRVGEVVKRDIEPKVAT